MMPVINISNIVITEAPKPRWYRHDISDAVRKGAEAMLLAELHKQDEDGRAFGVISLQEAEPTAGADLSYVPVTYQHGSRTEHRVCNITFRHVVSEEES